MQFWSLQNMIELNWIEPNWIVQPIPTNSSLAENVCFVVV